MKKFILPILVVTGLFQMHKSYSQQEGVITYEVKILLQGMNEENNDAPSSITGTEQLFFNENESMYTPLPGIEQGFENGIKTFRADLPPDIYYSKVSERLQMEQTEFMGRKFMITDSLKMSPWKLGSKTKIILGHECREASLEGDSAHPSVVAWYTSDFRTYLGPEDFITLPGTVLMVEIDHGRKIITASDIELRPLKKNELKAPKGGQVVTRQEYEKYVHEQFEKMKKNSNGNVLIGG